MINALGITKQEEIISEWILETIVKGQRENNVSDKLKQGCLPTCSKVLTTMLLEFVVNLCTYNSSGYITMSKHQSLLYLEFSGIMCSVENRNNMWNEWFKKLAVNTIGRFSDINDFFKRIIALTLIFCDIIGESNIW